MDLTTLMLFVLLLGYTFLLGLVVVTMLRKLK